MNYILFVTKQSLTQVSSSIMHFAYFLPLLLLLFELLFKANGFYTRKYLMTCYPVANC